MHHQPSHLPIMREITCRVIIASVGPHITNWFLLILVIFFIMYILTLEYLKQNQHLERVKALFRANSNRLKIGSERRTLKVSRRPTSFPERRRQSDGNFLNPSTNGIKHKLSPRNRKYRSQTQA